MSHLAALWGEFGVTLEHLGVTLGHFFWITLEHFGVSWGVIWDTLAHFGVTFACMQVTSVPLSRIFRKYLFSQWILMIFYTYLLNLVLLGGYFEVLWSTLGSL